MSIFGVANSAEDDYRLEHCFSDRLLGSRSALEWVLDQYKEKKPKDPTISERFNTYRFADYKEQVIELLQRVCAVSVTTVKIVDRMASIERGHGAGDPGSKQTLTKY